MNLAKVIGAPSAKAISFLIACYKPSTLSLSLRFNISYPGLNIAAGALMCFNLLLYLSQLYLFENCMTYL